MTETSAMRPLMSARSGPLQGSVRAPGDKSVSHRSLILGAMAVGVTEITGLLEAEDVLVTAAAMRQLGARAERIGEGSWRVQGVGVGGFAAPPVPLDFGNSGTGCRLSMGAVATTAFSVAFTGDASLRRRPMKRVLQPLSLFGATWEGGAGGLLPVTLHGAGTPLPIRHTLEVASAQVKSALLLAALNVPGTSTIIEPIATRDHTERMLEAFGAAITLENVREGTAISISGEAELRPAAVAVPSDPSSAAFPLVAALIVPGSELLIQGVMLNARRIGLIETLKEMGASIAIENPRDAGGERVGDLRVRHSALRGLEVPPERAPSMIDEYPILSVAAAFAEGPTLMHGLSELRVKESDRLSAIAAGLQACGVSVEESADRLVVEGRGGDGVVGGGNVVTNLDHRIAMSFLILGLGSRSPVRIDDGAMIATSFPDFERVMRGLGAAISSPDA